MSIRRKNSTVQVIELQQKAGSPPIRTGGDLQPAPSWPGGTLGQDQREASFQGGANSVSVASMAENRNSAELEDRIRRRAYEIYIERGRQDGHTEEHWLLAEAEILGITHAEASARFSDR
jgi:hypothetical protein